MLVQFGHIYTAFLVSTYRWTKKQKDLLVFVTVRRPNSVEKNRINVAEGYQLKTMEPPPQLIKQLLFKSKLINVNSSVRRHRQ